MAYNEIPEKHKNNIFHFVHFCGHFFIYLQFLLFIAHAYTRIFVFHAIHHGAYKKVPRRLNMRYCASANTQLSHLTLLNVLLRSQLFYKSKPFERITAAIDRVCVVIRVTRYSVRYDVANTCDAKRTFYYCYWRRLYCSGPKGENKKQPFAGTSMRNNTNSHVIYIYIHYFARTSTVV